jgi:hypothetical protein
MNYLRYKEFSAENLQFYLWHQGYVERFNKAPESDRALSPEWTREKEEEVAALLQKETHDNMRRTPALAHSMFKWSGFEKKHLEPPAPFDPTNPFSTPPGTAVGANDHDSMFLLSRQTSFAATYRSQASEAFTAVGVKIPCKPASPQKPITDRPSTSPQEAAV